MTNKTTYPGGPLRPTHETKISELLKAYPDLIEILVRYNTHFELLRRPTWRRLMTPLVTIQQAARVAQVDPNEMLAEIYRAIDEPLPPELGGVSPDAQPADTPMPEALRDLPEDRRVILDVREQVRAGQEPFQRIMQTVISLRDDQVLKLCNIFEPVPLYGVMAQRGFAHWTERRGPQDWCITFYRASAEAERSSAPSTASRPAEPVGNAIVVDARGLEPPQPMAKILENLPRIATGGQILALTDRRPMLLYPKLEERGFAFSTEETTHGWFETRIWK